jgi:hypothetical protein
MQKRNESSNSSRAGSRRDDEKIEVPSTIGSAGNNTFVRMLVSGTARSEEHWDTGDANLPRYYFSIRWGDTTRHDPGGISLPTNAAALEFALRSVRKLKEGGKYDEPSLSLIVTNEMGEQIFVIPF